MRGQRLPPERELASQLGVSRNSVREALRTLNVIGVISSTQGSGNYVTERFEESLIEWMNMIYLLRATDYRQFSELRQGLEVQAAKLALRRITSAELRDIRSIVRRLAETKTAKQSAVLDRQLHFRIAQISGNRLILEMLQAVSHTMDHFILDLRQKMLTHEETRDHLQAVHEGIVSAFETGDEQRLLAAFEGHFALVNQTIEAAFPGGAVEPFPPVN